MVEIDDIKDRESFEAWFLDGARSRTVVPLIAARAALRSLPYIWEIGREFTSIRLSYILRALLCSDIFTHEPLDIDWEKLLSFFSKYCK